MGFVSLILMILGWILIAVFAFGSGLTLTIGNLSGLNLGIVFVLLALCLGDPRSVIAGLRARGD